MKKTSRAALFVIGIILAGCIAMLAFALNRPMPPRSAPAQIAPPPVAACPACQCPSAAPPPACQPGISPALVLELVKGCRAGTLDLSEADIAILRKEPR